MFPKQHKVAVIAGKGVRPCWIAMHLRELENIVHFLTPSKQCISLGTPSGYLRFCRFHGLPIDHETLRKLEPEEQTKPVEEKLDLRDWVIKCIEESEWDFVYIWNDVATLIDPIPQFERTRIVRMDV